MKMRQAFNQIHAKNHQIMSFLLHSKESERSIWGKIATSQVIPNAPVAQMDRVQPSEGWGRTFESCLAHQFKSAALDISFDKQQSFPQYFRRFNFR